MAAKHRRIAANAQQRRRARLSRELQDIQVAAREGAGVQESIGTDAMTNKTPEPQISKAFTDWWAHEAFARDAPQKTQPRAVEPSLLTYKQAAKRLQISERTVWQLVHDKKLAVVRIGRVVRIDPQDLRVFMVNAKGVRMS